MENKDTLYTKRLMLRPLTEGDFDAAYSWGSNPANTRYMAWGPNGESETREFLKSVKAGKDFAVVIKDTGAVIGSCGIYPDKDGDTAEIGWILHIDYWKQGYGTELGGELIRYGFEDLKLRRITASCAAVNCGSYRVMEKNGMRREALRKKAFWARVDKEWIDASDYAILAEDYFSQNLNRGAVKQSGDCCFQATDGIFNYRAGAIIVKDEKILMVTNNRDRYYYTVGGRVRFGETAAEALAREIREELDTECKIGELAFMHENMFKERGTKYHEIALFYFVSFPDNLILQSERPTDSGLTEKFVWLPISELKDLTVFPQILKDGLARLGKEVISVVSNTL